MRMRVIAVLCLVAGCGDARTGPAAASIDLAARGSGVVRLTAVANGASRLAGGRAAPTLLRYEFHRVDHVSPGVG